MTNQQQLQNKWLSFQKNIREEIISDDGNIKITFNGFVEIIELNIASSLSNDDIQIQLPIYLNKGIKSVSLKAQDAFNKFKRQEKIL